MSIFGCTHTNNIFFIDLAQNEIIKLIKDVDGGGKRTWDIINCLSFLLVRHDLLEFVWNNICQFDSLSINQVNEMMHIPLPNKWGFWTANGGDLTNMPDPNIDRESIVTPGLDMPSKYILGIYVPQYSLTFGIDILLKIKTREIKFHLYRDFSNKQTFYVCDTKRSFHAPFDLAFFRINNLPIIANNDINDDDDCTCHTIKCVSRENGCQKYLVGPNTLFQPETIIGIVILISETGDDLFAHEIEASFTKRIRRRDKQPHRLGFRIKGKLYQQISNGNMNE